MAVLLSGVGGMEELYRILFLRRARFQRFGDQLLYRARMFIKLPENLYKDISHHSGSIGICDSPLP